MFLARNAHRAVILRRGPTDHVLVVAWDTLTDTFERGQWFVGRIYEDRCDLSPNGRLFVYFAAKHGREGAFTAISRPPYLTALDLFRSIGTYGGGGLFEDDRTLLLAAYEKDRDPTERPARPASFRVRDGQSLRIREERLRRGGFVPDGEGYRKAAPTGACALLLRDREYSLVRRDTLPITTSWADWDRNGDLLFARDGRIFRARSAALTSDAPLADANMLVDLCGDTFVARASPPDHTRW